MENQAPFTDQLANISPAIIVAVILGCTLIRLFLAKIKDPWARTVSETCHTITFVFAFAFLLIRPFAAQAFYIPSASMASTLRENDRIVVNKFQYRFQEPQRRQVLVFSAPYEATHGPDQDYIKRLIGLPGETIEVTRAKIELDGTEVNPQLQDCPTIHKLLKKKLGLDETLDSVKLFSGSVLVNQTRRITRADVARLFGRPGAKVEIIPGQTLVNGKVLDEPYTREDPGYDKQDKTGPDEFYMMGDNRNESHDSHVWGPLKKNRVIGHAFFVFWPPARVGNIR
jgi:signal peptidase I